MRNKLTVNDLSADVVERMKKMINEDRQMLKLRERHASFLRSHRYMEAMKLKQMMDGIEKRVINQCLSEYEGMSESMDNFMREMSEEDREEINVLTNSIIMLCDMVETFTMDCNGILKKYHPDYRIEMFDRVSECGKAAKAQVDFMSKSTDMVYQCAFAEDADKITEMVRNKAKAFIRKLERRKKAEHENC